jgi:hypothetical protein
LGVFLLFTRVILAIIIFPITTFQLYWKTRRDDNPKTRLKGKLIFSGSIIYILGLLVHGFFANTFLTLAIFLIGLMVFYGGFLLPPWLMRIFLGSPEADASSEESKKE